MNRQRGVLSFVIILGVLPNCAPAHGSDALKQRVLAEYPAALAKLESRYGSMHGTARYHETRRPPGQPSVERSLKFDFAFAPDAAKVAILDESAVGPADTDQKKVFQKVYGLNSKYGFNLIQNRPGDDFVLRDFSEDLRQGRVTIASHHSGKIQCAFSFSFNSMSDWLNSKSTRIDSVEEIDAAGGGKRLLIQLRSAIPPKTPYIGDGWIVVSPDDGWLIREYGRVMTRQLNGLAVTDVGQIDYARSPDGHLDPVKLVNHYFHGRINHNQSGKDLPGFQFELDFESVKYEALPAAAFHLPAFGLPEIDPGGNKGAATDRPYGLFALAVVGFGLAGGLKYASTRLKRA